MAAGAGAAPARLRVERAGPGGGSGARGRESLIHRRRRRGTAGPRHAPRPAAAPGAAAGPGPRRQPAGQTASGAAAGGAGSGERSGTAGAGLFCSAGGRSGGAGAAEGRGGRGVGRFGGPSAAPLLEGWSAEPTASCERRKERRAARSQRRRRIPPRPPSLLPSPPQLRCNRTPERRARPTSGAEGRRGIFRPSECGTLTWGRRREPRGYRSPPAGTAFRSDPPGRCWAARGAPLC